MEEAKEIWEELGLPRLTPQEPWHGYSLGDWTDGWDETAARAVAGDYLENGRRSDQKKRAGLKPETQIRTVED